MKPYYKLLLPALLLPLFSAAQSNYKPGYVVTLKGDTLRGFINIKEWAVNPRKISFKTSTNDKNPRELGVSDITSFAATNSEAYQRYIGLLNVDPTQISSLSNGRNTDTKTDSIFLKTIQKGANITLFEYADDLKNHYFVSGSGDAQPTELVYRVYKNDGKTINEDAYKQQLFLLSEKYGESKNLKTTIEKADYNANDLTEIAQLINKTNSKQDATVSGASKGTQFFASAGVNFGNITSGIGAFKEFDSKSASSVFPRIALGINVLANPSTGKLIFRAQLAYTGNKFKGSQTGGSTYSLTQNNISLIPQILYNFYNIDAFKLYAAAGAAFNLSTYSGNKYTYTGAGKTTVTDGYLLQSNWISYPFNIGVVIDKKFDITAGYIPNAIFTKDNTNYLQVSAVQIALNYYFK
ncbi:hypothetical protein [Mucilaginibacter ginsenosidivorax]|uniref:Outer membrane beta-barrel protein n=1 Tax=Mucilaginibacter ginsenosidivorax TaxID=862126 RepID=A0A5B8W7F4_9SPHI|nr:hypothetical protein [Mucilaginibacter ginsenosidivorax]QEC79407.1 hypothetical protein FSB76_26930 [Mucilaginibacter ginsenosidivorax]